MYNACSMHPCANFGVKRSYGSMHVRRLHVTAFSLTHTHSSPEGVPPQPHLWRDGQRTGLPDHTDGGILRRGVLRRGVLKLFISSHIALYCILVELLLAKGGTH